MSSRYPIPRIKLNNGIKIPIIGLGTWKVKGGEAFKAVKAALDFGYRHIDCAHVYENEKDVGAAIVEKLAEDCVEREDLFITSKLWNTFHRPECVENACIRTLNDLGVEYLDLYLMHWPMAYKEGQGLVPLDKRGKMQYSSVDFVETWRAMEELVHKNLTKSIGLSNFNRRQVDRVLRFASIVPVVNQVECHPYLNQCQLKGYLNSKGITLTCYSPLGAPGRSDALPNDPILLQDLKLKKISEKYKRTPAQIILRYQVERCNIVIPKSADRERMRQNLDIFNFKLEDVDYEILNNMDIGKRYITLESDSHHPEYPFLDSY